MGKCTFGTLRSVLYREVISIVSFIFGGSVIRGSFIRGSTVYCFLAFNQKTFPSVYVCVKYFIDFLYNYVQINLLN